MLGQSLVTSAQQALRSRGVDLRSTRFSQGQGAWKKSKVAKRSAAAAVEFFNF
jgi:hypothetical protein